MKINYFKQAWASIKQQPVVSGVSIAGTALAIFLIMVVVMMSEIQTAPFAPESNRDRWLVQRWQTITNEQWNKDDTSNGPIGLKTVKAVHYEMKTPEAVTAFESGTEVASISVPAKPALGAEVLGTDDAFWKVMDFTFIAGHPFTKADFESAIPVAVISKSVARALYGSTDIIGNEISINHTPYKVCGVVNDVSNLASRAFAKIWVPYSTHSPFSWCDDYMGNLSVIMLAKDPSDFPTIREEYEKLYAKFGDEAKTNGWRFLLQERPYTQEVDANTPWANMAPDMKSVHLREFITYLILLLVPAVNLSSMTHSRLQRNREQIGVRRAFGATRMSIVTDIFIENLVITLLAGILGLILSLVFAFIFGGTIFHPAFGVEVESSGLNISMLFHWSTFGWAMLFCFLLNLLSAGLPSIKAANVNIVNAISGKR